MRPPGGVSPTGKTIPGVAIPLLATSRVPNAVVLGGCAHITFLLVDA